MNRLELLPSMDARLRGQAERWRRKAHLSTPTELEACPFITISRQYGCPAFAVANELAERLNTRLNRDEWAVYDRKLIEWITSHHAIEEDLLHSLNERSRNELEDWVVSLLGGRPSQWNVFQRLARATRSLALNGRSILIGRGGGMISRDLPGGVHVRIIAPFEWRLEALRKEWPSRAENLTLEELRRLDKEREGFIRKFLNVDPNDAAQYDLVLNASRLSVTQQADAIGQLLVMV